MPLSKEEREQFLAEPHIAALSVAAGPQRAPLTVPIWYQYAPGGTAWILTGTRSRKWELVEAAGRFTLMVERLEPTTRYVSVEGPVAGAAPATDEQVWEIAARYLPEEKARAYVEFHKAELGDHVVVTMRPERWLSADMGSW
ncbi:pyridoxamine 5'-phosphate oxidase family protein [Pseudonocardia kunmingensis]|uniref:Pyridoxamine 5'-phosphate oxidase n=1 Tax=Pseudonocardia kunmingensis TaxID=630975 RepID=A0A543E2S1_9PSEU|nr:pyridoxamine 5'-phosphate oxidase family protein [Pseudonocardia kunmingensis]TQM15882.1 pyridoxamine 5'-phosphate oxidase [Pseudonocardia kunmingensis]